ncbi:MAG TPA: roadblock/LC7 domain-containing protein [Gemmatimonadales bacterium]|jgi:predicted regulator of Ras-like GTPase activity (Roadblock/LC7/MglB family)|nr:roadblock/LC7 domain-containing protein [Gemmatimonadales bacterium]
MSESKFETALDLVTRVPGVRGAMLVSAADGVVVAEALMDEMKGNAVAALAASLAGRLRRAVEGAGRGAPRFVQLTGSEGTLLAAPWGEEVLLVAVADRSVNAGLARLEMFRALEILA